MQSRFSSWKILCRRCIQTLPDCSSFQNRYSRQPSSGAKTGTGSVVSCICVGMVSVFCKSEPCKASAFCSVLATRTLGSRRFLTDKQRAPYWNRRCISFVFSNFAGLQQLPKQIQQAAILCCKNRNGQRCFLYLCGNGIGVLQE